MKPVSRRRILIQTSESIALTAVACALLGAYYSSLAWLPTTLGAAMVGGLLAGPAHWWRRDALSIVLTVLAGVLALSAAIIAPSAVREGGVSVEAARSVATGLLQGWARMMTVGVPAAPAPALLVVPAALAWTAALLSTVTALRSDDMLLPVLPPLLLFVVNLLLTSASSASQLQITAVFVVLALLIAFTRATSADGEQWVRSERSNGQSAEPAVTAAATATPAPVTRADVRRWGPRGLITSRFGRVVVGVPVLVVITALGVSAAAWLPGTGERFDPRSVRQPEADLVQTLSPLVSLKSQLIRSPAATVFTATVSTSKPLHDSLRLRVAALDEFDGVTWTATGRFVRPAARLPVAEAAHGRGVTVRLDVNIQDMPGTLLPGVGQPLTVRAADAAVDVASGTVAVWNQPSLSGYHYQLTGWVPLADTAIPKALPDTAGSAAHAVTLPAGLPSGVQLIVQGLRVEGTSPYQTLKTLETRLRTLAYSEQGPPGESYAVVARTVIPKTASERGSFAEQHASAFAVIARALGLPTRIAVGYIVPAKSLATGRITVTTKQAHAWPEVHLAGYGWVPFEPTDTTKRTDASTGSGLSYTPGQGLDEATIVPELAPEPTGLVAQARRLWPWVGCGLGGLVIVASTGVWMVKSRRRRRRKGATAASGRVLGAWSEAVDRLVEVGARLRLSMTPPELAAAIGSSLGSEAGRPLLAMTPMVEEAVFAPWEPGEDVVERAWACERELARVLSARVPIALRWRLRIDPRPLLVGRPPRRPEPVRSGRSALAVLRRVRGRGH